MGWALETQLAPSSHRPPLLFPVSVRKGRRQASPAIDIGAGRPVRAGAYILLLITYILASTSSLNVIAHALAVTVRDRHVYMVTAGATDPHPAALTNKVKAHTNNN